MEEWLTDHQGQNYIAWQLHTSESTYNLFFKEWASNVRLMEWVIVRGYKIN